MRSCVCLKFDFLMSVGTKNVSNKSFREKGTHFFVLNKSFKCLTACG